MVSLRLESIAWDARAPVSLVVPAGACVAVMGPSGTGKTRFLRALADLDPHEGEAYLDDVGSQMLAPSVWRKRLGMLPSDARWWLPTVAAHFSNPGAVPWSEVGFDASVGGKDAMHLSAGERQRLALLRLLAIEPEALLLDEPTSNLDHDNVMRVEAMVQRYREQHGAPVLWVTHDPAQAARVASSRLLLDPDGTSRRAGDSP